MASWPTHFARPRFSAALFSDFGFEMSSDIKYLTPEPLTLEQRIERLEKKLEEIKC